MSSSIAQQIFMRLAYIALPLLACLVGLILAMVFFRRSGKPMIFALIGFSLLIMTMALQFADIFVINMRNNAGSSAAQMSNVLSAIAIVRSMIQAAGMSCLIVAIFSGRSMQQSRGFAVQDVPPRGY